MADPIPAALLGLFAPWREQAACRGVGVDRFFVERGDGLDSSGNAAKRVCAGCPVFFTCLEASVAMNEQAGIWGGAGELERRWLRQAWVRREHGPEMPRGCRCEWCVRVERHVAALDGVEVEVPNRIGRRATHGRRSSYSKGCRCAACTWSASSLGQMVARLREDTAVWWAGAAPEGVTDEGRRASADAAAERLLVDVAAALVSLAGVPRDRAVVEGEAWCRERRARLPGAVSAPVVPLQGPASEDTTGHGRTMAA